MLDRRPVQYWVQTFGCQMNVHDSRRIEEVLAQAGVREAASETDADVLIMNTCSIREKAVHKVMSLLGRWKEHKRARPDAVLVVAGCVAQQEGEALLRRAPHLDLVLGPDNIPELPELVRAIQGGMPPRARTVFDHDDPQFLIASPRVGRNEPSAFVTIMKGCDERCTYCIVPHTRGEERYRGSEDIVGEVAAMVRGGVREVTLLGQTVNSWFEEPETKGRLSQPSRSDFAMLLRTIAREVPALERLRYTSPHPRHITDALIDAHRDLDVLANHVHMPFQSGSTQVLKRMSRRYTREDYIERVKALQSARPGMTLSTDIIVGFPGETEADFLETLSLVEEVGFVSAFCFKYSPRPYTPALRLEDDVDEATKADRLARLLAVTERLTFAHLQTLEGSLQHVLFESRSRDDVCTGRTQRNELVHVATPVDRDPCGQIVPVTITRANRHSLQGEYAAADALPKRAKPSPLQSDTRRLAVL